MLLGWVCRNRRHFSSGKIATITAAVVSGQRMHHALATNPPSCLFLCAPPPPRAYASFWAEETCRRLQKISLVGLVGGVT